ncbi:MAG: NAD(P)-dependent oxidoreductase [Ardenticatenia bacterium]|nr:NAD(P)-dependent oxidoreductase [Ardenticatenia bacterium]
MSEQRRPRVLVTEPLDEAGVTRLRQYVDVDERFGVSEEELEAIIPEYEGLIVRSRTKVTSRIIEAGKRLRVIGRAGVGLDNIDVSTARAMGIEVRNCPDTTSVAVAEHTFALLLALARRLPEADRTMKAGQWEKRRLKGVSLRGKTIGIIGFGRIGRQVARLAQGFGMRVLVNQPRLTPELALEAGVIPCDLPELLREADVVTLHVPLRPENVGLIGRDELALMKPSAFLINTARGGLVDEEALLEALETGALAGVGLDVFAEEPPGDHPLVRHPRVVATPHIGASTVEAQRDAALSIADQVIEVLRRPTQAASVLSLQIVPVDHVVPHEATDPKHVERLKEAIVEQGVLVNPPVVVAHQHDLYVVLDGATRTEAFRRLGIPHIVVQVVNPTDAGVTLHTWHHAISGPSWDELSTLLEEVPGLRLNEQPAGNVHVRLKEQANTLAYFLTTDGRAFLAVLDDGSLDPLDVLNDAVARYTAWGHVARTLITDVQRLRAAYPQVVALAVFPQFSIQDVLDIAARGKHLPQGITRFIVPGRVLRLNAPLDILWDDRPLSAKQNWLDEVVQEKLALRRVRYYQEPVVILEE